MYSPEVMYMSIQSIKSNAVERVTAERGQAYCCVYCLDNDATNFVAEDLHFCKRCHGEIDDIARLTGRSIREVYLELI